MMGSHEASLGFEAFEESLSSLIVQFHTVETKHNKQSDGTRLIAFRGFSPGFDVA